MIFASLVDANYYFSLHPDAARSGLSAAEHYLSIGWTLGYNPNPCFSTNDYLAANPDVAASGLNPLLHYATHGAAEGRGASVMFDSAFYLENNPDVAAAGANPLAHFMTYGVHEGRDPNAWFSTSGYLADNPDVAAAGVNAYAHFLAHGWQEGRDPSANFDISWYLEQNPDVAAAGVNPLEHYLRYGIAEHRVPVEPVLSVDNAAADEGGTVTYTFHSAGVPGGTVYSYVLSGVQAEDVMEPLTGTVILDADGRAEIAFTLVADSLTEGMETMQLTIGGAVGTVEVADTSPQTLFFLTVDDDSITGSAYDDTIGSSIFGGFAETDFIDGGAGTDVLYVVQDEAILIGVAPTVINVEQAYFGSVDNRIQLDTTPWSGLEQLWVHGSGGDNAVTVGGTTSVHAMFGDVGDASTSINGGQDITLEVHGSNSGSITVGGASAPTGTVSVSSTSDAPVTMSTIGVTGGTSVSITQSASNGVNTTVTMGTVQVSGSADTTSVSVIAAPRATASALVAGVNANSVEITDVNYGSETLGGTITSVTVANYTSLVVAGTGLTTLNLSGGSGNMIIDNSGLLTPTNRTLDLTVDRQSGGTLDDADIYTTLNVTTTGSSSTLNNITLGGLTRLNLDGDARLTLNATSGMSALQTVTVAGAAGLTADLSGSTVTSVDTSATTGTSTVTVDAHRATFTGGAGVDRVTLSNSTIDHAVSLGAGDDSLNIGGQSTTPSAALSGGTGTDTLTMTASLAATASGSGTFAGMVTGFERLVLTGSTNQTVDLAVLGIPDFVSTSGGNGLTLNNLADGGTLALTGAGTAYTIGNTAFTAGPDDTVHIILQDGSGAGTSFATTGITASRVEHIDITVLDSQFEPTGTFNDTVTLLGNSSSTITIGGNAGLTLTATSTALTSVDASGITLGGFTWTSGALSNAATIHGSAGGANTVNLTAATAAFSYTGGSGSDSITATNGRGNTVDLGDGTNSYTGSSGNHTVTGGDGDDTVVLTSGNNTVSLGNGTNAFTATSGNNTYVGGSGADTVTLGGGMNQVTLGDGNDSITLTAAGANLNIYTTIADFGSGDVIHFVDLGTETFNTNKVMLGHNAVFQDYANAAVAAGGNASVNGAFGWFQFGGDSYLVQSRHDGSGVNAEFINGVDMIVELTGLTDLSTAHFAGNTFSFGII